MEAHEHAAHGKGHYGRLIIMVVLSFIAMYALMYAMVDRWSNVYPNINQFYMAGLMAAPMLIIELLLMSAMYPQRHLNLALVLGAAGFMLFCWSGIRQQWGVSDQQFIKSMIPHHAGAILMCEQNRLQDPKLQQLCGEIVDSQRREIAEMKSLLQKP